MEKFYIFIVGFCFGFVICVLGVNAYHKKIVDRGYFIVEDKLYEVKLKSSNEK